MASYDAFWLPGIQVETTAMTAVRDGRSIEVRFPVLTASQIRQCAARLKARRREVLARRSIDEIIETLDSVARFWLEDTPLRSHAVTAISVLSGFSEEMVSHAIHLEQISSRGPDMRRALDRELGNRLALDGFIKTPKGRSTAVGPELIGGIFSANIPALPHLTVMRSFLVKAACMGRVSRGEPLYLPLYAQSLAAIDPELSECLAVVYYDRDKHELSDAFLECSDHLIAYGGDAALAEIEKRLPHGSRATWHGHRMGFAWLTSSVMTKSDSLGLAEKLAYDFSVFDQHACLAPQAVYVESGGEVSPETFAEQLSNAMTKVRKRLPARALLPEEAPALRSALELSRVEAAMGDARLVSDTLQSSVVIRQLDTLKPGPLDRFVTVVPVDKAEDVFAQINPVRQYLQCAAVAGISEEDRLQLARLGVTRICPPGAMGTPSMVWAHDGRLCLADLVRWCDEESLPPG